MNGMNGYLLLVVCLSTLQKQVQGTACTVSTVSTACTGPFDVCQNDICKIGVGGDCSTDTTSCVANAGCMTNECDCITNYAPSGSGTCVEPLNCHSCTSGCNTDAVTGSTQITTFSNAACMYCYIAWNDQDAARGCLTSATATSNSITSSGCSDGWTEGLTGTGCACDSALCNETPAAAGYTQNTAFTLKASATLVSMAILWHHLFMI